MDQVFKEVFRQLFGNGQQLSFPNQRRAIYYHYRDEGMVGKRKLFADIIDNSGLPSSLGLNEEEIFNLFNCSPRKKIAA